MNDQTLAILVQGFGQLTVSTPPAEVPSEPGCIKVTSLGHSDPFFIPLSTLSTSTSRESTNPFLWASILIHSF
ncbi:hypothetical protein PtB15_11B658 [Puccinia triticina]|nr:hypothetical protein PtB15_11B658 [Puccinia triticina]